MDTQLFSATILTAAVSHLKMPNQGATLDKLDPAVTAAILTQVLLDTGWIALHVCRKCRYFCKRDTFAAVEYVQMTELPILPQLRTIHHFPRSSPRSSAG